MKRLIFCFVFSSIPLGIFAQQQLIREESLQRRQNSILSIPANPEKTRAVQMANSKGLPVRTVYPDGRIKEIRRLGPGGKPQYLTTFNMNAAHTVSTSKVWQDGGNGLRLSGEGLVAGVWDGGVLRVSHREFGDRGRNMNPLASEADHSTHVSGTIGAAGIDNAARGMAGRIIVEGYDWNNDLLEMDAAAKEGLLISNHSYGYVLGYDYNIELDRWEWWGDTDISEQEEYLFGYYHIEARENDLIAFNNPYYLIVKSAGNDRGDGPAPGSPHYVWEKGDWVLSNMERQVDGGPDGFDCMGPVSTAKNIMSVGAVGDLMDGYVNPESVRILYFSAFGPTDDGRIKPDVVGNGEALYSTYSKSDTDYGYSSGTSMSAPNVTGSMALLQEHYHAINGEYLKAASLKGLVLHTADDAGNSGPDYKFGWGLMNTLSAARIISNTDFQQIQELSLGDGNEIKIHLFCDGTEPIRATICWTDPPGRVPDPALDPSDRILVNDLDIRLIREINGQVFRPYILDPAQPDNPATTGDNYLDNVEQVFIENPGQGFYDIVIRHKGELAGGNQAFSLIVSGLAGEYYATGDYHLTDNNGSFILTSAGEYLPDMQAGWLITPENKKSISLYFNSFETEENKDVLRIYDGKDAGAPILAELSGTGFAGDTLISSTEDTLWIVFTSDSQNQGEGFSAFYCTTAPEGSFVTEGEPYPCEGSTETYMVSGQEGTYYAWDLPEGWYRQDSGADFTLIEIGSGTGLLGVLPYNLCGESAATGMSIEPVSMAPEIKSFWGDTLLCAGVTGTIGVDDLPGATYEWMLPENWLGSSETSELTFIPSLDPGKVLVTAVNACDSGDTLSIPVLVKTIPEGSEIFSLSDNICQNSLNRFYIEPSDGTTYQWSVEGDWNIIGDPSGDTVEVEVGESSGYLGLKATNECGFRNSDRLILPELKPETPLLMDSQSIYEKFRKLEVQNAASFIHIQWYLNNVIINSPLATGPSYVALVPGLYSVEVQNRNGCTLLQAQEEGKYISGPNSLYAVYGGAGGTIIVQNTTNGTATINMYDMTGNLLMIRTIDPGYNRIDTDLKGVYIVSVSGLGNLHVTRLFLH